MLPTEVLILTYLLFLILYTLKLDTFVRMVSGTVSKLQELVGSSCTSVGGLYLFMDTLSL